MKKYKNLIIKKLGTCEYQKIFQQMQDFTNNRTKDSLDEIWVLEHEPVFTQGLAGKKEHIIKSSNIPIVQTDRGGQVTYHGPGQLICYLLIDLKRKNLFVKEFVNKIEQAIINFLKAHKILANRMENAPGIYVKNAKICSIGLKIKKYCSYHGISFNINMNLTPFNYINPCGFKNLKITQLKNFVNSVTVKNIENEVVDFITKEFNYERI